MTLEVKLPAEIEAKIRERAGVVGQNVDDFILHAVAAKLGDSETKPELPSQNGASWADKLRSCIELHPVITGPVDDSRESIYAGRGE